MSDLQDLYQQMILDHYRSPRNCRQLEACTCSADGNNPLCGDRISVFVEVLEDRIADIGFEGSGCAISTASASLMTEAVKGQTVADAHQLSARFRELITDDDADASELGKLEIFAGVRKYPTRVKCATLAWHTLDAALNHESGEVTTE